MTDPHSKDKPLKSPNQTLKMVVLVCALITLKQEISPNHTNTLIKFSTKTGIQTIIKKDKILINVQTLFTPKIEKDTKKSIKYWIQTIIRLVKITNQYGIMNIKKHNHENELLFEIFKNIINQKKKTIPILNHDTETLKKYNTTIIRAPLYNCGLENYKQHPLLVKYSQLKTGNYMHFITTGKKQFTVETKTDLIKILKPLDKELFNYIINSLHNNIINESNKNTTTRREPLQISKIINKNIKITTTPCKQSTLQKIKDSFKIIKWDNSQNELHKIFCSNIEKTTPFYNFEPCGSTMKISYGLCKNGDLHLLIKTKLLTSKWEYTTNKYYFTIPLPKKKIGVKYSTNSFNNSENTIEYDKMPPIVQKLNLKNKDGKILVSLMYE